MNIIFFGSDPWFSPPVLEAILKAKHQVALIVTKGDAFKNFRYQNSPAFACHSPSGSIRTRLMARSSAGRDLRFMEARTEDDIMRERLNSLIRPGLAGAARPGLSRPDVIILAAYGPPFLSTEVLNWPKYGCLNVHASLLPRWRGASPVFGALANGDRKTGVTIMKMIEKVDRGNILGQKALQINQPSKDDNAPAVRSPLPWSPSTRRGVATAGFGRTNDFSDEKSGPSEKPYDTRESLTRRLGILGGELIVRTLKNIENGQINEVRQPAKSPTPYTRRLTKDSGRIDWKKSPEETWPERSRRLERFIRAVTPWPGAWTEYRAKGQGTRDKGKMLKILKAHLSLSTSLSPQPLAFSPSLVIDLVQLPGKNPISWKQFLAGHPGARLESY